MAPMIEEELNYLNTDNQICFALKSVETSPHGLSRKNFNISRYGPYSGYSYNALIHSFDFKKNWWSEWINDPLICVRGWHCVMRNQIARVVRMWSRKENVHVNHTLPTHYLIQGNEIWVVAVRGNYEMDNEKGSFSQMRFIQPISSTNRSSFESGKHLNWWNHLEILEQRFDKVVNAVKANPVKYGFDKDDTFAYISA
jgi:hypothetical protein